MNKKSYYVIPAKIKKNRSLGKEKKTKHKPAKLDCKGNDNNVVLSNGILKSSSAESPEYSSIPSNGCRNSSLASTVNEKPKT